MKDLFIIPECYIDTNLVETLIITDGCNHQKGCNTVVKTMQQKFANAFSVGIIDEDKRQVSYVKEFSEIARTPSLRLKKHGSKSHREPGSMGPMHSGPGGRVIKGKKLPGRMGGVNATVQRLTGVKVDAERNLILVKGAIPGAAGSFVVLKETVKPNK